MSNKLNILRRIWGKTKTDDENASELQSKNKDYFQITFDNHQNPEASFTLDLGNPKNVFCTEASGNNNTPFYQEETKIIMEPKPKDKRRVHKKKESNYDNRLFQSPENSIVLSEPTLFMLQNRDAYVYRVESEFYGDGERPDLEFVIYIPIDTAVNWLDSTMQKNPERATWLDNTIENNPERAVTQDPTKGIIYGAEEDDAKHHTTVIESFDSDEDDEEEQKPQQIKEKKVKDDEDEQKPKRIKERKVKGPKKNKKKARRIITTYEEDEDSISLGRLRPQQTERKPVTIVEKKNLL